MGIPQNKETKKHHRKSEPKSKEPNNIAQTTQKMTKITESTRIKELHELDHVEKMSLLASDFLTFLQVLT